MSTRSQSKHRIKIPHAKYYNKIWLTLYDGGSGQWLYVCQDGPLEEGRSFTFIYISIYDMVECCGRDATMWWDAEVGVIDLFESAEEVPSALRTSGMEMEEERFDLLTERDRLRIAEALFSHGAKAVLWNGSAREVTEKNRWAAYSETDPKFRTLRAEAREFAESLFDEVRRNELLSTTVVNRLGQTAREYMSGIKGLWDKLREIKRLGDKATSEQQLILRMYQSSDETLGAGPIPKDLKQHDERKTE